ncbi:MAG TPA: LssY C-terminal domain-containing protein, partial [Pseudolabrys sp.]|nr:LssY C-terminal domain-containing protein [Pseudolabrys sp.]
MKWSQNRVDAASGRSKLKIALTALGAAVLIYGVTAYVLLPRAWTHYEHQKGLAGLTMVTHTAQGIPGDPINVGMVGTREDVLCAMHAAGWYPADPITFRSSVEIVGSVVLRRPYDDAPVSNLYYDGRRQD